MESAGSSRERRQVEQAVSRAVRENLALLQRTTEELSQAVADLVSACSSSRSVNALPPMLRAQAAAAALAAALDVLSHFVTQSARPSESEEEQEEESEVRTIAIEAPAPSPLPEMPPHSLPTPMARTEAPWEQEAGPPAEPFVAAPLWEPAAEPAAEELEPASSAAEEPAAFLEPAIELSDLRVHAPVESVPVEVSAAFAEPIAEPPAEFAAEAVLEAAAEPAPVEAPGFDPSSLPQEEQDLHRRANRVAKVSMQDVLLMRPEEVRIGRQQKDLCRRLRNDLDKARKEYERRFGSILNQPVDYFHHWMVEILANGDPEALGEYPYPSPLVRS
jgi:hypothetical protein